MHLSVYACVLRRRNENSMPTFDEEVRDKDSDILREFEGESPNRAVPVPPRSAPKGTLSTCGTGRLRDVNAA